MKPRASADASNISPQQATHKGMGGHWPLGTKTRLVTVLLVGLAVVARAGGETAPPLSLSSPGLTFSTYLVRKTSPPQTETVTNTGTGVVTISAVTIGGANFSDFATAADACTGVKLAPNATCTIGVKFAPVGIGTRTASLNFLDNASNSPQSVILSGTGLAPLVDFTPPSILFGTEFLETTSTTQMVTVNNSGTTNLVVAGVTLNGSNVSDFAKTSDTCTGAPVTPSHTCTVGVTFTPLAVGNFSASLNFADNAVGSPQAVSMAGSGVSPAQIFPGSLVFAGQAVGATGAAQSVSVTNNGTVAMIVSGVNATGDFSQTNTCATSVAPGASCQIQVVFTPAMAGTRYGTLSVGIGAGNTTATVGLTGTGNGPLLGVFTQRYDNARTGQNAQEALLTTSNVNVGQFGKLFSLPVDGQVYAQPLFMEGVAVPNLGVHNVVFVATEHDSVYAFDADGQSMNPLWHASFLNPATGVTTVPSQDLYDAGGFDINPEVGITSTPVIDPASGTLYVTAKTKELQNTSCTANCAYSYFYRLHALDITTGAEKFGGPVTISANVPGAKAYDQVNGMVSFSPRLNLQRPGLLLLNGMLYLGFGSHGDRDYYHGWLMAYDAATLRQAAVFNVTPNGDRGAIWQSGGGIAADADGYVYLVTSNGKFDVNTGGNDYGDSVLKMQLQSGQLQVADYFTPANQSELATNDLDLGSSPVLILPDQPGPSPHLLAVGGKDGRIWLLNRDDLGAYQINDAGAVQVIPGLSDLLFGGISYWNGNIYVQEVGDFLNEFPLVNGEAVSPTVSTFKTGFFNAPMAISSNGTSNAVLWLVQTNAYATNGPGILYAFSASDVTSQLYDSHEAANQRDQGGPAVKFVIPTVANGKVYVGAGGQVDVYGLLP